MLQEERELFLNARFSFKKIAYYDNFIHPYIYRFISLKCKYIIWSKRRKCLWEWLPNLPSQGLMTKTHDYLQNYYARLLTNYNLLPPLILTGHCLDKVFFNLNTC